MAQTILKTLTQKSQRDEFEAEIAELENILKVIKHECDEYEKEHEKEIVAKTK